jgi:hypothetical protein
VWCACCLLSDAPVENKFQKKKKKKKKSKSEHNERRRNKEMRGERGEGRIDYERAREVCN